MAAAVSQETEYGAEVSSVPMSAPFRLNCTPATPTLSEAVAETATVPETICPWVGEVIETVGGVVSPATATDYNIDQAEEAQLLLKCPKDTQFLLK